MLSRERKERTSKLLSRAEANIKRNRVILFGVIILVEIVLIIVSVVLKWFSISEFVIDIVNNIIGILPPILLFDFFYERISAEASSIEMSKKITATMMGQPETLKLFNVEDRKNFLRSTVSSVINDADLTDMILDNSNKYVIDPKHLDVRIRKEFNYNFELGEELADNYDVILGNTISAKSDYYYVKEILNYKAKLFSSQVEQFFSYVNIGFMFSNDSLDEALRDKRMNKDDSNEDEGFFVFRESLDLLPEHRRALIDYLNKEDGTVSIEDRFKNLSKLCLKINDKSANLQKVYVNEYGIVCKFEMEEKLSVDEYSVRVIFSMPRRWGSVIEVALVDPTFAPKITLSYPSDKMDIDMYSFLSKSDKTSLSEAHELLNGIYDISLSEWVHPVSGIIFTVDKKNRLNRCNQDTISNDKA